MSLHLSGTCPYFIFDSERRIKMDKQIKVDGKMFSEKFVKAAIEKYQEWVSKQKFYIMDKFTSRRDGTEFFLIPFFFSKL